MSRNSSTLCPRAAEEAVLSEVFYQSLLGEKDQCHDSINLFDTRAPNVRLAPVSAATKIRARKGPGSVLGPCTYICLNGPVMFCHHYLRFVDEKAEAGEAPDL